MNISPIIDTKLRVLWKNITELLPIYVALSLVVVFLRYDGMDQDDDGVWTAPGGGKVAWFTVSLRNSCDGGCEVLRGRRLRHAGRGA